jgi:[ribosomal protein S18]-alanine N-acetyltransferase
VTKKLPAATLRRGRMSDAGALVALERQFFTPDHQISLRGFRHYVASPKSDLIIADVAGQVAGCALVNYRQGSALARLYTIAVGTAFQRRGIARQLLDAAERAAERRRRKVMRLEVRADDAGAIALYESSGYLLFGRRHRYYDGRIDALRFDKPLGPEPRRRSAVVRGRAGRGAKLKGANRV